MSKYDALKKLLELHQQMGSHSHGDESPDEIQARYKAWVNACYEAMPELRALLADVRERESQGTVMPWQQVISCKFPAFDSAWDTQKQLAWFDDFRKLVHMDALPSQQAVDVGALENAVCDVIIKALAGYDDTYKHELNGEKFIKWGLVDKDIRAIIRKHLVSQREGWQPIETAPKDGTEVLIASKRDVYTAYWREEAEFYQGETKPGWQLFSCEDDIFYSCAISPEYVTHWMPLPSPPLASTVGEK